MNSSVLSHFGRFAALAALCATLVACSEDPVSSNPPVVSVPTAYTFASRFAEGQSSVDYGGQVVRNLLIQDLGTAIRNLGRPGAAPISAADLMKFYEHSDASAMTTLTAAGTLPLKESSYSAISTGKKLSDKISPEVIIGFGTTADALVREWFEVIAQNSNDPSKLGTAAVYIDADGRDLSQFVTMVLFGSVSYYQGTGVYLKNILSKDNSVAVTGAGGRTEPFTEMEHNWDEAFGYFGAARDFSRYTDAQLAGTVADYVYDSNGDGSIDLSSEYNYPLARYAGRRDKDASGTDFSSAVFNGFLTGRATISAKGTSEAISAQRTVIANAWEEVLAANVIHYVNSTIKAMDALTSESSALNSPTLSAQWSEMKAFTAALQFNPFKRISSTQLSQLHTLMGTAPVFAAAGTATNAEYRSRLVDAREVIRAAFAFSEANALAW